MCFSFESNYHNWLLAFGISMGILVTQDDKELIWAALFALTFSQIQIAEAMVWIEHNNGGRSTGNIVKYMVPLLLLQPTVQSAMGYKNSKSVFLLYLTLVSIMALIYSMYKVFVAGTDTFDVSLSSSHHLVWNRYRNGKKISFMDGEIMKIIYGCGVFLPLLFIKNKKLKYSLLGFGIMSYVMTAMMYPPEEFPSLWCFYAVGYMGIGIAATLW